MHRRIRHANISDVIQVYNPRKNVSATNDCSIHWANLKDLGIAASGIVEAWSVDECERVRPELAWDFFNTNNFCISQLNRLMLNPPATTRFRDFRPWPI
jgi:hypothetical protein